MPLSEIDEHVAVIAVDLQKGIGRRLASFPTVVDGVATSVGVESTAREAYARGFNGVLAVDAMTDPSSDAHHNSVTRIFPRLGETTTTEEVLEKIRSRADAGDVQ